MKAIFGAPAARFIAGLLIVPAFLFQDNRYVQGAKGEAETVAQVGLRIFEEMLLVASGKPCRAEILGFNDFAIKRIGPSM